MLFLCGCGGAATTQAETVRVTVVWGQVPTGFNGMTYGSGESDPVVVVSPSTPTGTLTLLLIHELGHCVGMEHGRDGCAMTPIANGLPCTEERAWMDAWRSTHTLKIASRPADLAETVDAALRLWGFAPE